MKDAKPRWMKDRPVSLTVESDALAVAQMDSRNAAEVRERRLKVATTILAAFAGQMDKQGWTAEEVIGDALKMADMLIEREEKTRNV